MLYPAISEVKRLLADYETVPVFYEVLADTCTPIQIFDHLQRDQKTCFILESVDHKRQWGRYSFIGVNPKEEIRIANGQVTSIKDGIENTSALRDIGAYLNNILRKRLSPTFPDRPKLTGGLCGYFGYDAIRYIEPKLQNQPEDDLHMPDCHLFLYDEIVAFDHLTNQTCLIFNINRHDDPEQQYKLFARKAKELAERITSHIPDISRDNIPKEMTVRSNLSKKAYCEMVARAKEHIENGEIFQVVPSQRYEIANPPDSFLVYRYLRTMNPSPYLYYLKTKDYQVAGASPEMLVNVTKGVITTKPIAGTVKRGTTEDEDRALMESLLSDPKERAEHTMLVDLGRNDVGRVSQFGTVEVTRFMEVEKYSKVSHLVSDVKGLLREDLSAADALFSALPAGTLSGAPKIRAMELIDELETVKRGLYGGTIGYLGFDGNLDSCIAIRTALYINGKAYVQAGGGIVADSDPEKEYAESRNKAQTVLDAMAKAAGQQSIKEEAV